VGPDAVQLTLALGSLDNESCHATSMQLTRAIPTLPRSASGEDRLPDKVTAVGERTVHPPGDAGHRTRRRAVHHESALVPEDEAVTGGGPRPGSRPTRLIACSACADEITVLVVGGLRIRITISGARFDDFASLAGL
jgi:hypothetical protein